MKTKVTEYVKKNGKLLLVVVTSLIGIILIALSYTVKDVSSEQDYDTQLTAYGRHLEERLSSTLEKITGENTVDIVITFDSSFEKVYLETSGEPSFDTLSKLNSTSQPLQVKTKSPEIKGVMIACTSITTPEEFAVLKKAAATVLDISQNKIYIIGGENGNEKRN